MQATIVLEDLRIVLRHDDSDPGEDLQQSPLTYHHAQLVLGVIKEYGLGSEEAVQMISELAGEIKEAYSLGELPDDHHWDIDFETWATIDGDKVPWEEL